MGDCPDREGLQRLTCGLHPPDRQQLLERHLEGCERCRRLLQTLGDAGSVVPDRPVPAQGRLPESPALKRAMEQLLADPDAEAAAPTRPPFLQPTDRPGFLGKLGPYE